MRKMVSVLAVVWIAVLLGSSAAAQGPPPAKVVVDQVVEEEVASTQSVLGVLYYERKSEVSTDVSGLVEEVIVVQGDRVKKDEVLVRLDTEILEREISLTQTRLQQIDLRIENSRKDYERLAKIFESEGVSEKIYDDALFDYENAVKEKQATEDTLAKLLIQKRRSVIRAPFNGVVLSKDVDTGGWAQQGRRLLIIGASSSLHVRAPVSEDLLKFVVIGEETKVIINAFDRELTGRLVNIDPIADVKTKNVFLKINIPYQPLVAENMSATVHVASSPKKHLRIFKRAAVVKHQGKDFVYTVKEGKAAIMPITIVAYLGDRVGVDNPSIVPGMPVVVEGNERLRPDQPVVVAGE
ncbi:MAG TPA: efflux RND transporter periplasmic adaptor subunit [Desulfopila sp.]|nr:efflux RND transporter periplasmic adaptor subunit [Desulfopila sp.]